MQQLEHDIHRTILSPQDLHQWFIQKMRTVDVCSLKEKSRLTMILDRYHKQKNYITKKHSMVSHHKGHAHIIWEKPRIGVNTSKHNYAGMSNITVI